MARGEKSRGNKRQRVKTPDALEEVANDNSNATSPEKQAEERPDLGDEMANRNNEEDDQGEELIIPADPLQEFDLPENFFVAKADENLGVGRLGEPRLIIHHITNENFKSYQGKVVLGPFHQNFSSVIGPNGSGKSNVIDSLLFVFGFKASKIRLKKLSSLIHFSNSVKSSPPTSCTVTIHFMTIIDDLDAPGVKYSMVPGSEFSISRTAFKDNTSCYRVDGKRKQARDIKARLRQEGIDLDHNRFLILQGEVEQISLMKPKALNENDEGMLEYLEDIIGTNRYKTPVEKLKEHTDVLSDMRQQKLARVTAMEGEVNELRAAKNEANDYLKQLNQITIKEHLIRQIEMAQALKALKIAAEAYDEKNLMYEKLQEDQKGDKDGLKKAEKALKEVQKRLDKSSRKLETVSTLLKNLEKEQTDITHENDATQRLMEKQEKELVASEKKLKKLETEPERLKALIDKLEAQKITLKDEETAAQKELADKMEELSGKTDALQNDKSELEKVLLEKSARVTEIGKNLKVKQAELKLVTSQYDKVKQQYEKAQKDISKFQGLEAAEEDLDEMRNSLREKEDEQTEIQQNLQKIETEFQSTGLPAQLDVQVRKLREKREARAASGAGGSRLGDFFKQMQEDGQLGNGEFYGRLGDLGAIDKDFDVAVSTAAGNLDSFVCDSNNTATQCIKLLKQHNMGQANFIALNQMEGHRRRCEPIQTPKGAPRLFDQIKVREDKFKPAFWFSVQDTLVANDMREAQELTNGMGRRWRVVTVQGELVEASGAMTGGGGRVKRGKMGQQVRQQETVSVQDITAIENNIEAIEQQIRNYETKIQECQGEMRSTMQDHRNLQSKLEKKQKDIKKQQESYKVISGLLPTLEADMKRLKPKPSETKQLKESIEALESEQKEASQEEATTKKDIKKIQDQIQKINDQIQGPAKALLNDIREKIKSNAKDLTKNKAEIGKIGRTKKSTADKVAGLQGDIEGNKGRLAEIESRLETIEGQCKEEIEKETKLKLERKEIDTEKNGHVKEAARFHRNLQEAETKLIDLKHAVKELKQQKKGLEDQMTRLTTALNGYTLDVIEEDDADEDETDSGDEEEGENSPENPANDEDGMDVDDAENEGSPQVKQSNSQRPSQKVNRRDAYTKFVELDPQDVDSHDIPNIEREIFIIKENASKLKGRVDLAAIEEFKRRQRIYEKRVEELTQVTRLRNKKRMIVGQLEHKRADEFMEGFNQIKYKLKEMYQMITLGGDADLELVDNLNPFSEGVVFSVRPPNKSWKNITNLSGGEKTLSSLALVFALHYYKPTPFYVMDEIDAALDFRNVCIIANYIKDRTKNAQFVIISLRSEMFEMSDRLVGIYKVNDRSRTTTIDPNVVRIADEDSDLDGEEAKENTPPNQLAVQ